MAKSLKARAHSFLYLKKLYFNTSTNSFSTLLSLCFSKIYGFFLYAEWIHKVSSSTLANSILTLQF